MPNSVRRTKIVATLGPAWSEPAQMTALLDAGVNVVRINASHATPEIRARWIGELQRICSSRAESVAIAGGPPGAPHPGGHPGRAAAPRGRASASCSRRRREARAGEIPTTYDELAADVRLGARILLDDGLLALEVTGVTGPAGRGGGALRRRAQVAQGDEPPRARGERAGAHREGPGGRASRRWRWAWTTSRSRSCAGRRTWSSCAGWCRGAPS